ncbi:MAG: 16S rRNA (guanine(966)-N(2))-methyltransferase RsmD [Oscillatoriales cyanobacterium RM1_1_9]|nr:16S rRNA (guanine(966)-N(2))-methyltransferase RsmD [Oscillatoriales cyanobacterium SM2_3_0]NJO44521.1 16S rRNA (guanine(966)-N(2))-methyltransferase RsmD [Oscillatoriales cyanobacterium RM2_1_1]NJO71089.1 16S rRNA (guanine(966)-N(2))-methyltransferase RsmD [Oscillatoriales cyanobacterium RM1_1_9]
MNLRIYGNRQLKTLPGQDTRPTLARVREAIFNIWQGKIQDCRWLDLCAGIGSMGAEALCRGASLAVAIEQSSKACRVIRENWQLVANEHQKIQVIQGNVLERLKQLKNQQFDYIYFDPPYASGLYQPVIERIAQEQLLAMTGELAVEHSPKVALPSSLLNLGVCQYKTYGNTSLTFYKPESDPAKLVSP